VTQSPIEPPNDPRRSEPPVTGPSRPLTFDEMIAVLVAFLSLGSVLFWGMSRGNMNLLGDLAMSNPPVVATGENPSAAGDRLETSAERGEAGAIAGVAPESNTAAPELSAREQLAAQAAARRARAAENPRGLWDDIRAGMAGAAAGVAGVAATPDAVNGAAEPPTESPTEPPTESSAAPAVTTAAVPLSAAATAPPKDALRFEDVPDNYWAKPYIDALSSRELISGFEDGSFKPDQPVTRAQIANIVSRTFDLSAEKESIAFSDVQGTYWAKDSIDEVVKGGFMTGFPKNIFQPNSPVTRAQAFATLATGLELETPGNVQAVLARYTDTGAIPVWAKDKTAAATAGSLVVNYPNLDQLKPGQPTTRAELSALIYQALVNQGAVEPIESQYLVKP
jgi:hypothetical protein